MENKMLEDSALEGVSGGTSLGISRFDDKLNPGDCVVGKDYYVVFGRDSYFARLEEITPSGNPDECIYTFRIEPINGTKQGTVLKLNSSLVDVYPIGTML